MGATTLLAESAAFRVLDVACDSPRSGPSAERAAERAHLVLMRRGTFGYHRGSAVFVADLCTALLYDGKADYRISHPAAGGDDSTIVELAPGSLDELFAPARACTVPVELPLEPRTQWLHLRAHSALASGRCDTLAGDEILLRLLQRIAQPHARLDPGPRGPAAKRRRIVARAKTALSENLDRNVGLTELAREAGCSAAHLMRLFRAETGCSVRGYRRQLRVAAALERLRRGATDLATVALDCGFASHSHLCETFRRTLSVSPTAWRRLLGL